MSQKDRTIPWLNALEARGLRIAPEVAWWERAVEATRLAERWEAIDLNGEWRRYWRRYGSVPKWAAIR